MPSRALGAYLQTLDQGQKILGHVGNIIVREVRHALLEDCTCACQTNSQHSRVTPHFPV